MTAPGLAATDDPTLLIPGSLTALYDDAAELRRQAGELEEASADIARNDVATWLGDAAGQWDERRPALATQATVPAEVYRASADVLEGHAQMIELARELVEIAIVLWVRGATAVSFAGLACEPLGSGLPVPSLGSGGAFGGASPFGSGSSWTSPLARSLRQQAAATPVGSPGAELCAQAEQILADLRDLVARSASAVAGFLDACCLDMPDGRFHPGGLLAGIGDWLYGMAVFGARFSTARLYADGDGFMTDAGAVVAGWQGLMNQVSANPNELNRLLLDSETYRDDPARWLGRLTPDAALAILGAPAAASRLARLTASATRVLDNLGDAQAGPVGRVFTSKDPLVGDVATALDAAEPGSVLGLNQNIDTLHGAYREVDIELADIVIQVKSGPAGGITAQIERTAVQTGRTVIGYAPDMPAAAWANAARNGVPVARTIDELLALIGELR